MTGEELKEELEKLAGERASDLHRMAELLGHAMQQMAELWPDMEGEIVRALDAAGYQLGRCRAEKDKAKGLH